MKKPLLFTFLAGCLITLLASCQSGKPRLFQVVDGPGMENEATDEERKEANINSETTLLLLRVRTIYEAAEKAYQNTGELGTDTNLDEEYCSEGWRKLVDKVLQRQRETDFLCLDADYWVMGQDVENYSADNFRVKEIDIEAPKHAVVTFDLHNFGEVRPVRITLVYEKDQWMIDNFYDVRNNLDWRKMMEEYLQE